MRAWAMVLVLVMIGEARGDDAMQAAARAGEASGAAEVGRDPLPTFAAGGERGQGTVRIGTDDVPVNQVVPGGSPDATSALSGLAGDRAGLEAAAAERLRSAGRDPSHSGEALRALSSAPSGAAAAVDGTVAASAAAIQAANPLTADLGACTVTLVHRAAGTTTTHAIHERRCEVRVDPPDDRCAALTVDSRCSLVRGGCPEDGLDPAGHCVVESRLYHCIEAVATPNIESRWESPCAGAIRCMGDDCVRPAAVPVPAGDLTRATAALSITQHLVDDWVRSSALVDRAAASTPEPRAAAVAQWLPGVAYRCRRQVGGPLDCCGEAQSDRGAAWFARQQAAMRQSGAAALAAMLRAGHADELGSWTLLGDPAGWSDDRLDRPLTSRLETVTAGRVSALRGATSGSIHQATVDHLAAIRETERRGFDEACSADEWELAHRREIGSCLSVGSYCESPGGADGCRELRDSFVCYDSPTARVLREALAGPGAVERGDFGTPRHPKADGLPADALRNVQVAPSQLDEIAARLALAGAFPNAGEVVAASSAARLTGPSDLHGDPERPSVTTRTRERLAGADLRAVAKAVERDQRERLPAAIAAVDGPGDLAFSPALVSVRGGQLAQFAVTRTGGTRGAVTVDVGTRDGTARAPEDYSARTAVLRWADGEGGERRVAVPTRPASPGRGTRTLEVQLSQPTGGARLYPNDRALLLIDDGAPASGGDTDPPPPGVVAVRKWIPSAPEGRVAADRPFSWRILVTNATAAAVPLVELVDRLPPNLPLSSIAQVDCLASAAPTTTATTDDGGRVTRCRWPAASTLPPGGQARMDIHVRGLVAGRYANHCELDLGPTTANGTCDSVAEVLDPVSLPGPPTGCAPPPAALRRRAAPTRWDEVFDGRRFPASRDVTPLVTDLGRYLALEFETRAAGSEPALASLSWDALQRGYPSVLPDGDFYVTISRCPGDFGLGHWPTAEPSESPGCRSIRRDTHGNFIDAGGLHLVFDGVPDRDSCHLAPSTRYYLNVVFADPRPQAFGAPLFPNLAACPPGGSTCGVQAVTDYSGQ